MWGAIVGDTFGSMYEWSQIKTRQFEFFGANCEYTDDSVCTAAVAHLLLDDAPAAPTSQRWCRHRPDRGSGGMFGQWIGHRDPKPERTYGNGASMRV